MSDFFFKPMLNVVGEYQVLETDQEIELCKDLIELFSEEHEFDEIKESMEHYDENHDETLNIEQL